MSSQSKSQNSSIFSQAADTFDTLRLNFTWRWITGVIVAGVILFVVWNLSAWFQFEKAGYFTPIVAAAGGVPKETAIMCVMCFVAGVLAAMSVSK